MIAELHGSVSRKGAGFVVVTVGGIGLKAYVISSTLESLKLGREVRLSTYLAVREDALELYGFEDEDTREFFELLLTVTGIGPKSALAILNIAPVKTLQSAIASGDAAHLTKTTGIGTKRAERITMELKDKIDVSDGEAAMHQEASDAIEALKALGYSQKEARDALQKMPADATTTEQKIKHALKHLGK